MKYSVFQQTCKDFARKMNNLVKPKVAFSGLKFHKKPCWHECTFEYQGIRMYLTINEQNVWKLRYYDSQNNMIKHEGFTIDEACATLFRNGGK